MHLWMADKAELRFTNGTITVDRPSYFAVPGEPSWAQPSRFVARAAMGVIGQRPAPDLLHGHFVVTTGMAGWETPPGYYTILNRVANETMTSGAIGAENFYRLDDVLFTQYFTDFGHALRGLFLHNELIQPRKHLSGYRRRNDFKAPEPGFSPAQYEALALLYVVASVRAGFWMIPAYHAVIDEGIYDKHDDPQNFEFEKFNEAINRQLARIPHGPETAKNFVP